MKNITVGIDLGGSNIAALAIGDGNTIMGRAKDSTERGLGVSAMAEAMRDVAYEALESADLSWENIASVGVAIPGAIEPVSGELLHAPNLGWKNQPARAAFEGVFGADTILANDVNCGLVGEFCAGAARGTQTAAGFFVGTGLGGGLIIQGHLHTGLRGAAGELGHQIVRHKGRRCACGNRGCLEAYCSKVAFGKQLHKKINIKQQKSIITDYAGYQFDSLRSKHLKKAYQGDDPVVHKVMNKGARMLGLGIANIMAVLAPECVVLGGGVMEALGDELLPAVRKGITKHLFGLDAKEVDLRLSMLGDDAVPLGAAILAGRDGTKGHLT